MDTFNQIDVLILAGGVIDLLYDFDVEQQIEHQLMIEGLVGQINFANYALPYLRMSKGTVMVINTISGQYTDD